MEEITWPDNRDIYSNVIKWLEEENYEICSPSELRLEYFRQKKENADLFSEAEKCTLDLCKTGNNDSNQFLTVSPVNEERKEPLQLQRTNSVRHSNGGSFLKLDSPLLMLRKQNSSRTLSNQSSDPPSLGISTMSSFAKKPSKFSSLIVQEDNDVAVN